MDIGKKLKELRLQNDLTLGDLASRSELTKGFLSQVERNLTTPSIATLQDILEALGSNLSEFFREEEERDGAHPSDAASAEEKPGDVCLSGPGVWLCAKRCCHDRAGRQKIQGKGKRDLLHGRNEEPLPLQSRK